MGQLIVFLEISDILSFTLQLPLYPYTIHHLRVCFITHVTEEYFFLFLRHNFVWALSDNDVINIIRYPSYMKLINAQR